ncbi:Serine/threonine-protein phosphatase 6 regulatory subunit 3 [Taenia crassiceps]|uniref:Serine/threonine-protein phosphatase 6 regulatory subunit 3 n=1 Tax=Taenia crassiceps TaxID=6207 RepID=A0ABR4QBK5_9CEST
MRLQISFPRHLTVGRLADGFVEGVGATIGGVDFSPSGCFVSSLDYNILSFLLCYFDPKEETTLEEFLDDDYIIQHVMARCTEVINYLLNASRISHLIELVTDQSNITFDAVRFKRPSVAAEILSSGVPALVDFLVSTGCQTSAGDADSSPPLGSMPFVESLLAFIDTSAPLNSLSASFFVKIMTNLLFSKAAELVPYLRARQPDFLVNLLRHIESPAICELLIEMPHQDNNQQHAVAQWFLDRDIVSQLLDILSPKETPERQESAARCLVELINVYRNHVAFNALEEPEEEPATTMTMSANTTENEKLEALVLAKSLAVLNVFESEAFLSRVLDIIADECSSATCRNAAIDVFLACVDKAKSPNGMPPSTAGEYDIPLDTFLNAQMANFVNPLINKANCPLLKARAKRVEALASTVVISRLPKLYSLLQSNSIISSSHQNYSVMPTTVGVLNPPLGKSRLAIVNLISILPQLRPNRDEGCGGEGDQLKKALCHECFLPFLMRLFETYAFNSLLHKAVTMLFKHLLSPPPSSSRSSSRKPSFATKKALEESNGANSDVDSPKTEDTPPKGAECGVNRMEGQLPDYLVRHLLDDCHIIEWILRLSCIPGDRPSNEEPSSVCRASKTRPKPGYSGYLWQIANLVNSRFPTSESLAGLPPEVLTNWQVFVQRDLAAINEAQTITKADRSFEKPAPISLGALHIGEPDSHMAQLFRLLHGGTDLQFLTSRLGSIESRGLSDAAPRPEPNEDAFDDDTDKEVPSAVNFKGRRGSDIDEDEEEDRQAEAENSDVGSGSSSNSSDEEDLQSPVTIRQQRTHQTPVFLNSTNGRLPFVKPVDTSVSPWTSVATIPARPAVGLSNTGNAATTAPGEGDRRSANNHDEDWADFESASLGG